MNESPIVLACEDVTLGYEHKPLLEHLTLTVRAGDYLCIVGENGSGKSTLLRSLLGLLPPLAGKIDCPAQREGRLGYLPQQTPTQRDFPATVTEVVLSGFSNRRARFFYTAEERSAALMNLGKLGVLELKDKCYRELSGGQQQRVALARTLTQSPSIILADEPVAALDPVTAKQVMQDFVRINQEMGISILLNIHHVELALEYADRIIGIRAGKIVYDGPSDKVDQAVLDSIYGEDTGTEASV